MSRQKDNKSTKLSAAKPAVEAVLHRVLRATGRIVPQTEEEVAQAEALVDEDSIELPEKLRTPPTAPSARPRTPAGGMTTKLPSTPARESLSRAARNGAKIPTEVLERMRQDRLKAEGGASSNG